jgi:hypoxanthine phosphoribosyltransferase
MSNPSEFPDASTLPTLLSMSQIQRRTQELGRTISQDYEHSEIPIVLLGVLKGAFMFCSDLARALEIPCCIEFVQASSYKNQKTSAGIVHLSDLPELRGQHVIIVEDILDTGLTLHEILKHLQSLQPASLEVCTLLRKDVPREVDIVPKYVGFEIPNRFVIGYGLDYAERYREVPEIRCLD